MKSIDISNVRFGNLVAIKRSGYTQCPSRKFILWECKCDCGNLTITRLNNLRSGTTKSCGCLKKGNIKHKMRYSQEYTAWCNIKNRCNNKTNKSYKNYGGRGISVCERWTNSFENFFNDMGEKPSKKYSIDRINNDGNYEPGNCRWATAKQQANNKRTNLKKESKI